MGKPAAKKGDRIVGVDTHIVMVPSPGGPIPTSLPHPFSGILDNDLSSDVSIDGQPAATVGSIATNTPSHFPTPPGASFQKPPSNKAKIFMGSNSVFINGKPAARIGDTANDCNDPTDMPVGKVIVPMSTVFIGGAPTTMGARSSSASGSGGGAVAPVAAAEAEAHFLDVKFVDKAGFPITGLQYSIKSPDNQILEGTLTGDIRRDHVPEGDYEIKLQAITRAEWSEKEARVGDTVKLFVETVGFESGAQATFHIWQKDFGKADRKVKTIGGVEVEGGAVEAEWEYEYYDPSDGVPDSGPTKRYSAPQYYFIVQIENCQARSGILDYKDWAEIELRDQDGNPVADAEYILYLSNGEVRAGKLGQDGTAREEGVPPGRCEIRFPAESGTQGK